MNKRELAKSVAVHSDVDLPTVSKVLEGFTDVVTAVVSKGEAVAMSGFAKFVKVDRPARMGRNPATGEQIWIKASKKARITPVKAFKDAVLNPTNAPKLKRGAFPIMDDLVKQAGKSAAPAPARKATASKTAAKKSTAKKTTARKASATKRGPAKKTAARRAPAKKTAARKTTARKTAARKTTARKATRRR
jgi:DNA-binding protein HU-beta